MVYYSKANLSIAQSFLILFISTLVFHVGGSLTEEDFTTMEAFPGYSAALGAGHGWSAYLDAKAGAAVLAGFVLMVAAGVSFYIQPAAVDGIPLKVGCIVAGSVGFAVLVYGAQLRLSEQPHSMYIFSYSVNVQSVNLSCMYSQVQFGWKVARSQRINNASTDFSAPNSTHRAGHGRFRHDHWCRINVGGHDKLVVAAEVVRHIAAQFISGLFAAFTKLPLRKG